MAVKRSLSAGRMLCVFEIIARLQPIGVSALARQLGADKSAVQRDLMTLADAGWIRPAPSTAGQWELTPHILTLAHPPHSSNSLRQRVRPVLEQLRAQTDETTYLTVPHGDRFVVIEALESPHMLRMVPPVGMIVPVAGSATARAILPFLSAAEQMRLLGKKPSDDLLRDFANTRERGYAISDGGIVPGAVTIASAVTSSGLQPVGAVVITGPADRITPARQSEIGALLRDAGQSLSQGWPVG